MRPITGQQPMPVLSVLAGVLLALVLTGNCVAETEPADLRWVGDEETATTVMMPLIQAFVAHSGLRVDVDVQTSTKGIRAVATGQAQLGGSGRYAAEGMPEEMGVDMNPIAWDAVAVAVHPDNSLANLSQEDLRSLYTGRVRNWQGLGGGDAPVNLYLYDDPLRSVEYQLPELLFGHLDIEMEEPHYLDDTESLVERIAADPHGVGFMGLSVAKRAGLKVLKVDGVEPSVETLEAGDYPLFRTLYLVSSPSHQQWDEIRRFIRFAEQPRNRAAIKAAGAVPYKQAVRLVVQNMKRKRAMLMHTMPPRY